MSDIERLRETILTRRKPELSDEYAWRRIEALVLRVCNATNVHQLAGAVDGWRSAERMAWSTTKPLPQRPDHGDDGGETLPRLEPRDEDERGD